MTTAFEFDAERVEATYVYFCGFASWLEDEPRVGEDFAGFRQKYYVLEGIKRRLDKAVLELRGHKDARLKRSWSHLDSRINRMYFGSQNLMLGAQEVFRKALVEYEKPKALRVTLVA